MAPTELDATPYVERVRIRGFRSLGEVDLRLRSGATVLIGANGSGKSNFIRFFEMLSWMLRSRRLGQFVAQNGGADDQLHGGSRRTSRIEAHLAVRTQQGGNEYRFTLAHAHPNRFFFSDERFRFNREDLSGEAPWQPLGSAHDEARIVEAAQSGPSVGINPHTARAIVGLLRNCAVYQFHDTSHDSEFLKERDESDYRQMRRHGGNLAAVLHWLERNDVRRYERICRHIARALPDFDRFDIEPLHGRVLLRWKARCMDKPIGPHLTSDGSLRFFALVTLLNLPSAMLPNVILLDEPELGLHPAATTLIGAMIGVLALKRQVIVATQSPLLVDAFDLNEVVVAEVVDCSTRLRPVARQNYLSWLDDGFTSGELWQKNLLGGRP